METSSDESLSGRTEAATAARQKLGWETDREVLRVIKNRPGISTYDIAKLLRFSSGRVDGSVGRLQRQGEIDAEYVLRDGRIVKELHPKGFAPDSQTELMIDRQLFDSPEVWKERAFLYALDRITLGITPFESQEWHAKALASEVTAVRKRGNKIVISVPSRFLDFYIWKNSSYKLSVIGSSVLVTVMMKIPIRLSNEGDNGRISGTRELDVLGSIAAKSRLDEREARVIGKAVKKGLSRRYRRAGSSDSL